MAWAILLLIPIALLLSAPLTLLARAVGRRLNALDGAGVNGQHKEAPRRVPNTGGAAVFLSIALPMLAALLAVHTPLADQLAALIPGFATHLPGLRDQTPAAVLFLAALTALHVLGLVDDRRPLGPYLKLSIMLGLSALVVLGTGSRLLTAADAFVGGPWLSILLSILWLALITNALNIIDNMDGLCAGVAAIAASCFLAGTLTHNPPQWFISAALALTVGACLGFLLFNFPAPKASIFLGDSGSLVLGFTLGFLTIRTTYLGPTTAGGYYALLMPLLVLAVPLYDLATVSFIRLRQGRSPMLGDLNHISHRLTRRGLSKRDAVLVIYGLTAVTSIGGVALPSLAPWQAALVGAQALLVLLVLALFEGRSTSVIIDPAAPPPSEPRRD